MKRQPFIAIFSVLSTMMVVQIFLSVGAPFILPNGVSHIIPNGLIPVGLSIVHLVAMMIGLKLSSMVDARLGEVEFVGKRRGVVFQMCFTTVAVVVFLTAICILAVKTIIFLN